MIERWRGDDPVKSICPKCNGDGTIPRTEEEDGAEIALQPTLAHSPKTCDRCGGSGEVVLTPEEIKERVKE